MTPPPCAPTPFDGPGDGHWWSEPTFVASAPPWPAKMSTVRTCWICGCQKIESEDEETIYHKRPMVGAEERNDGQSE